MKFRSFVWVAFILGGITASKLMDKFIFNTKFHFNALMFLIGIILLLLSFYISSKTGKLLKKFGKEGDVPRFQTNKLVREGIYSCMRHPMHLGLMFIPFGIAFLMNSISYILFIAPITVILIFVLIKTIEEPEAIKKFGDEYIKYMKEVPMFNLSLSCLKKLFQ